MKSQKGHLNIFGLSHSFSWWWSSTLVLNLWSQPRNKHLCLTLLSWHTGKWSVSLLVALLLLLLVNFLPQIGQLTSRWANFECSLSACALLKVVWHVSHVNCAVEAERFSGGPSPGFTPAYFLETCQHKSRDKYSSKKSVISPLHHFSPDKLILPWYFCTNIDFIYRHTFFKITKFS